MPSLAGRLHTTLFNLKFALRRRGWPVAAPAHKPLGRVVVSGFFDEALGIGRAGRLTAGALTEAGFSVVRDDLRPYDRGLLTRSPASFMAARDADTWLIHANAPETRIALFTHDVRDWAPLHRIGYWAWESDLAPGHWLPVAQWLHEIWVPSAFCRDAFAKAFVAAGLPEQAEKLRVMPHPVPVPSAGALPARTSTKLRVLTLFDPRSGFRRKNPAGALETWLTAFPQPTEKAQMIIKSLPDAIRHPAYDDLKQQAGGRADIVFQPDTLSPRDQDTLIAGSDILLSLHRGEGFGLPLAEAMAAGGLVIATGWSGNMAFMTAENSVPVPARLVAAAPEYNGPQAQWAEPDIAAAALALRRAVDDAKWRHYLGKQARADIGALHTEWLTLR